jgi:hypothetical protein
MKKVMYCILGVVLGLCILGVVKPKLEQHLDKMAREAAVESLGQGDDLTRLGTVISNGEEFEVYSVGVKSDREYETIGIVVTDTTGDNVTYYGKGTDEYREFMEVTFE